MVIAYQNLHISQQYNKVPPYVFMFLVTLPLILTLPPLPQEIKSCVQPWQVYTCVWDFSVLSLHQVVSIWHSHLSSLIDQMVTTHLKEVEQGAELSPRLSFLTKSAGSGHSHQLGKDNLHPTIKE